MTKLDDGKITWIIKSKSQGGHTNRDISDATNISISTVQQLYREYKSSNGIPKLMKACREFFITKSSTFLSNNDGTISISL